MQFVEEGLESVLISQRRQGYNFGFAKKGHKHRPKNERQSISSDIVGKPAR